MRRNTPFCLESAPENRISQTRALNLGVYRRHVLKMGVSPVTCDLGINGLYPCAIELPLTIMQAYLGMIQIQDRSGERLATHVDRAGD